MSFVNSTISTLRSYTSEVHKRLHVHPLMAGLMRNDLDLEYYQDVLKVYYAFYKNLQFSVSNIGLHCPILSGDIENIEQDLSFLSYLPSELESSTKCVISLKDQDEYLGMRYVIQGSHLGGQVIAKHIRSKLHLSKKGLAFYTADAKGTASEWREFMNTLEEKCHDRVSCARAAKTVFLSLEKHLWNAWNSTNYFVEHSVTTTSQLPESL